MNRRHVTTSGVNLMTGRGRRYRDGDERGVLAISGATYTETYWFDIDAAYHEMRTTTEHFGFPVVSLGAHDYWGNQTMMDRMGVGRDYGRESLFSSKAKVHLLGVSAGGLSAMNFAKRHPEMVKSMVLLIPVIDVQDVYDNNRSSFQSVISTAYGGRPGDAWNPAQWPEELQSIPTAIYASENDAVTPWSITEGFAADAHAELFSMGSVGHFWDLPWNRYRAGAWFTRYNA